MKHLVIGHGEVGSALAELLACDWLDVGAGRRTFSTYDVLHIAIPYGSHFLDAVRGYSQLWPDARVVVHSSVPLGTCDILGAIHSPVRGVHPNLLDGLRTFVKFFGGPGASDVASAWPGVARVLQNARTCEALKLWDTTQYGVHIRLMQEIYRYCEIHGLPFDEVYELANATYNHGFAALNRHDVVRPVLAYMGPDIGGHCVLPNAELLGGPVARVVRGGFD